MRTLRDHPPEAIRTEDTVPLQPCSRGNAAGPASAGAILSPARGQATQQFVTLRQGALADHIHVVLHTDIDWHIQHIRICLPHARPHCPGNVAPLPNRNTRICLDMRVHAHLSRLPLGRRRRVACNPTTPGVVKLVTRKRSSYRFDEPTRSQRQSQRADHCDFRRSWAKRYTHEPPF